MSRIKENKITVDWVVELSNLKPTGTFEEMTTFNLAAIAALLVDISKSLAILADKAERSEEE